MTQKKKNKQQENIKELLGKTGKCFCPKCKNTYFYVFWNVYQRLIDKNSPHLEVVCVNCGLGFRVFLLSKITSKK